MLHNYLESYSMQTGAHYSVGHSTPSKRVLVQLQDERADQVRVKLTPDEARNMAKLLNEQAGEIEALEHESKPHQYCAREKKEIFGCRGRHDDCYGCIPHTYLTDWPCEIPTTIITSLECGMKVDEEAKAREKWNSEADEFNQWDSLGLDERGKLIASCKDSTLDNKGEMI